MSTTRRDTSGDRGWREVRGRQFECTEGGRRHEGTHAAVPPRQVGRRTGRQALTLVDREIANYTRAIAKGDFSSLEQALGAAEQRRATIQSELARLDGHQPAVLQLTPAALERHLEGMTEKLRSGVNGKVREAIEQSIGRILVGVDGSLTIEAKPDGLLGVNGAVAQVGSWEDQALIEPSTLSTGGRVWKLITAR